MKIKYFLAASGCGQIQNIKQVYSCWKHNQTSSNVCGSQPITAGLAIEPTFPQGIQKPAVTPVWRSEDVAVRDQQGKEAPWDWDTGDSPKWVMSGPHAFWGGGLI